ncbi:LysE family translocator, partial [Paraburkholderia sp. SIMBA_009]
MFHIRDVFARGDRGAYAYPTDAACAIQLALRITGQLCMGGRAVFANNLRIVPARFDMSVHAFFSANLLLAYTAYFIGTASPGP